MLRSRAAILAASAILFFSACGESPVAPEGAAITPFTGTAPSLVTAPDPVVFDFDELTWNCNLNVTLEDPYVDPDHLEYPLPFLTTPFLAPCAVPSSATIGLMPSARYPGYMHEVQILLPFVTGTVSIDFEPQFGEGPLTLIGYDAAGVEVAAVSGWSDRAWTTLTLSDVEIAILGILGPTANVILDNLTLVPYVPKDPTTRDACKDGGWEAFGFRNQGQCIRFVNTGQDSRV